MLDLRDENISITWELHWVTCHFTYIEICIFARIKV